MHFFHSPAIRQAHPGLYAAALVAGGIHAQMDFAAEIAALEARARQRLAAAQEGDWPEVQAWRRAFSRMGLKPTQYRCASESLLRRLRKDGDLPRLHPLVDLCNAVSVAFGIPVAALDLAHVTGGLEVCMARGDERYLAFSGEWERPEGGEVTFRDQAGHAHARRWTHRQSGLSAVQPGTRRVLIVAEALHEAAAADLDRLAAALAAHLPLEQRVLLSAQRPRLDFD